MINFCFQVVPKIKKKIFLYCFFRKTQVDQAKAKKSTTTTTTTTTKNAKKTKTVTKNAKKPPKQAFKELVKQFENDPSPLVLPMLGQSAHDQSTYKAFNATEEFYMNNTGDGNNFSFLSYLRDDSLM